MQVYPNFFKINIDNSLHPNLEGYYKKQEYEYKGKPVFKKPGKGMFSLYLNSDDKWALGKKTTRVDVYDNTLSMKEANLDLPTTGLWTVEESDEGSENEELDKSATASCKKTPGPTKGRRH